MNSFFRIGIALIIIMGILSPFDRKSFAETSNIQLNNSITGNLQKEDEIDLYQFNVETPGKVSINFKHQLVGNEYTSYWSVSLLDSENHELDQFYSDGGELNLTSSNFRLPKGTYYIKIKSYSFNDSDYEVKVNYSAEDNEYEKENNGDFISSNSVSLNNSYFGNTQSDSDNDFYKFTVEKAGKVWVNFKHQLVGNEYTSYWSVSLLDSDNHELDQFYSNGGELNLRSNYFRLPKGTYYIKIKSYSFNDSDYEIKVNYSTEDNKYEKENNGDFISSNSVSLNNSYFGNIQSDSDNDFYKFTVEKSGKVWVNFKHQLVGNEYTSYWSVSLLDSENNELKKIYSDGKDLNLSSEKISLSKGTYYVKVNPYSFNDSDYELSVQYFDEQSCSQYRNVNKIWWGGMELKLGQIGRLTVIKDTPLFKLNGEKKEFIRNLKAGEFYRIYAFKPGMLSVGGGFFVGRDSKVKYETPSKNKILGVQCINSK
jgi:uncharacterized membrane protein